MSDLSRPESDRADRRIRQAFRALFWRAARGDCPRCGLGKMFRTHFQIRSRCPSCNLTLQPDAYDNLGVYAFCYSVTMVATLIILACLYFLLGPISPYTDLGIFELTAGFILVGFFPNMKGLWVGFHFLHTGSRKQL